MPSEDLGRNSLTTTRRVTSCGLVCKPLGPESSALAAATATTSIRSGGSRSKSFSVYPVIQRQSNRGYANKAEFSFCDSFWCGFWGHIFVFSANSKRNCHSTMQQSLPEEGQGQTMNSYSFSSNFNSPSGTAGAHIIGGFGQSGFAPGTHPGMNNTQSFLFEPSSSNSCPWQCRLVPFDNIASCAPASDNDIHSWARYRNDGIASCTASGNYDIHS